MKKRSFDLQDKGTKLIVVLVQQLSENHLAMRRMVASNNMLFVHDEKWRKENLPKNIRLPLFVDIAASKL